jgi:type IV pilus assembly protein PilY1
MFQRLLKPFFAAIACATFLAPLFAGVAQDPLLNKTTSVPPNLTLIMDTSGSMAVNYLYKFGTVNAGFGRLGPPDNSRAKFSPDVNRLHYDPRVRYERKVNWDGSLQTQDAPTSCSPSPCTAWTVYFRNSPVLATDTGAVGEYYSPAVVPVVVATSIANYPNNVTGAILTNVGTKFPKFSDRTDCLGSWCTATQEAQNHANWNKWYSTRADMAETGIGAAFQTLNANSIRLGWGNLENLSNGRLDRGVALYDSASTGTKYQFYQWLYGNSYDTSTPIVEAVDAVGRYYSRKDEKGPWGPDNSTPTTSTSRAAQLSPAPSPATTHASCRRSFAMVVTDGYYNGGNPGTAGNADGNTTTYSIAPATGGLGWTHNPVTPYKDNLSNTLADYAYKYWGTDLRPDLPNKVAPIRANGAVVNPSTWQNMSFYAVTLGIEGTLPQTTATLAAGNWPALPYDNKPEAIDDLWHATVNARGSLLNANNAQELSRGLKKMFDVIAGNPATLSGVSLSATTLRIGTRKYKPEYISGVWKGNVTAIPVNPLTGNETTASAYWQVETGVDTVTQDPISTIPSAASRTIATWKVTSGVGAGVTFNSANTVAANAALTTDMVNYLRGDPSKELRKSGGTYRDREAKLGDIVNSNPTFIRDNFDLGYDQASPAISGYRAFVNAKAARPEGVLFVGSNDGMLHGFRDSDGVEVFGYVPQAVLPDLHKLAETPFVHQYFVDGPTVETDAYWGSSWKNVLLSTTGGGAKAVFALDVTSPTTMSAANVLWEVNSTTSGFSNLGYVLTEVQSGILDNGQWVAIFGNGYEGADGVARLYVVNLQTGALLKEISTGVGGSNGLGGVRVVRDAISKRIVGAYAGDLKGNMWKFDLTGTSSADWKLGVSGALYAGSVTQPITSAPAVLPHPNGGYVVSFGTGKFFETTDTTAGSPQAMYGIWDKEPFSTATIIPTTGYTLNNTALTTTRLQVQQIGSQSVGTPAVEYFTITSNTVAWGDGFATGGRGWYINLGNAGTPPLTGHLGERVVYPIERLAGTYVIATTLTPVSASTGDPCETVGSGAGWTYIFDGVTGSGTTKKSIDTNGDNVIDSRDALVSGFKDPVDGRPTPISIESTPVKDKYCIVTAQQLCTTIEILCGQIGSKACPVGTTSGVKSREWRQLFMR